MSNQKLKSKIYALIIVVTLFVSVNKVTQAEEKSRITETKELADNGKNSTANEVEEEEEDSEEQISDVKIRYTPEEVEIGNEIADGKGKKRKNKRTSIRQARGKNRKNNIFETQAETRDDLKVGSIQISQTKEISSEYLLSQIPVKPGDNYSNKSLSDIYLSLKRLGYITEANVYPKIQGNSVNIVVEVAEVENAAAILERQKVQEEMKKETEYTISSVDIEGTKIRSKEEYLKDLPVKPGDIFIPQKALEGAQKIFNSGYFAKVDPKIDRKIDNTVSIVYEVQENPIIQSINFEGNTLYKNSELEKALGVKKGEILNGNLLNPDENGVIKLYNKDGYSLARIETINVSNEGNVNIGLTEGIVDSVEVQKAPSKNDNERQSAKRSTLRTKPYVFERYMEIKPGQVFQTKNIKSTISELYRTGMFTEITPAFEGKENDPNARVVKLLVEERPTTTINGSISYGTSVGLVGELKLADSNFLGKGQDAAITLSASTLLPSLNLIPTISVPASFILSSSTGVL